IGTGALRMIHSRVVWMLRPVERSITVSAPQRIAHTILSTSSSTEEVTAELPILALILVRKLRPMIIGSSSAWLMLDGIIARPRAISSRTNLGVMKAGSDAPKLSPSAMVAAARAACRSIFPSPLWGGVRGGGSGDGIRFTPTPAHAFGVRRPSPQGG